MNLGLDGRISPPGERVSVDHMALCRLIGEGVRVVLVTGDENLRAALQTVLADIVVLPCDLVLADADGFVPEAER